MDSSKNMAEEMALMVIKTTYPRFYVLVLILRNLSGVLFDKNVYIVSVYIDILGTQFLYL